MTKGKVIGMLKSNKLVKLLLNGQEKFLKEIKIHLKK